MSGKRDEQRLLVAQWNASHGNRASAFAEAAAELQRVYLVGCAVQVLSGGAEGEKVAAKAAAANSGGKRKKKEKGKGEGCQQQQQEDTVWSSTEEAPSRERSMC